MVLEAWHYAVLVGAGLLGGMINVIAGGGSILTVPAMIFLGVPGPIANGTNRVAIFAQNVAAISTFYKHGFGAWRLSLTLGLCALPGAVLGAFVSTRLSGEAFNIALAAVMLITLLLMQTKSAVGSTATSDGSPRNLRLGHGLMFLAGLWGGFIQIGMGFVLMPILHRVMGIDLVNTNAHKVFIVNVYTLAALVVFALSNSIWWHVGIALAVGNSLGGFLGAKLTIHRGETLIRRVLTLAILLMVIKLVFFS